MKQIIWRQMAWCALIGLGIVISSSELADGQQTLGGILGTIADSSGATVSEVKVELVSNSTGLTRSVIDKNNGDFAFSDLPAGSYIYAHLHACRLRYVEV
jgi:hypothetical protein